MDKICIDCQSPFILTQEQIKFFESKNFPLPKRCKNCRFERKKFKIEHDESEYQNKPDFSRKDWR